MKDAKNSVVAIYKTPVQAEIAIRKMEFAELDLGPVSLVWGHPPAAPGEPGCSRAAVRLKARGPAAIVAAEIRGALSSSACFLIPGLGEVFVAGPLVDRIPGGSSGVPLVAGLTSLGISLWHLGLPRDSILQYETALGAGKGMVLAHGAPEAMVRTREILAQTEPDTLADHLSVRPPDAGCAAEGFFPARLIYVERGALPKPFLSSR